MIISIKNKGPFKQARSIWSIAVAIFLVSGLPDSSLLVFAQDFEGTTYYIRSTVGQDHHDGLSPKTAWKTINRASRELGPGDTLFIGPGLYREGVSLANGGLPGRPLRIIGDSSGKITGDLTGPVVMAGSVPIDESIFKPEGSPGVFTATISEFVVGGVVEMDGLQHRYQSMREPSNDVPSRYIERVRKIKSSLWYNEESSTLYIHTSDERPPRDHELEIIRFYSGFYLFGKPHVWISGITFRHYTDGAIYLKNGSDHGRVFDNIAFGSRQGIRVLNSHQAQIIGNTMFRNENCGAYFLHGSLGGLIQGNFTYENAVGLRFSSESNAGIVIGNLVLDNRDAGISFETLDFPVSIHNKLKGNTAQLRLYNASFFSDKNCFEIATSPDQSVANWNLTTNFKELGDYTAKVGQDLNSKVGDCGIEAEKVDVERLHRETLSYSRRALEILENE